MAQPALLREPPEPPVKQPRHSYSPPRLQALTQEEFQVVQRNDELMDPAGAWPLRNGGAGDSGPDNLFLSPPPERLRTPAGLVALRSGVVAVLAGAPCFLLSRLLRDAPVRTGETPWGGFAIVGWIVLCLALALNPAWLSECICAASNPCVERRRLSLLLAALALNVACSVAALHWMGNFVPR